MEIKARCLISELPTRLRRLAEYRRKYTTHTYDGTHDGKCVDSFQWKETPEGRDFWDDVYFGRVPYYLEAVLDKFEQLEHAEGSDIF